MIECAGEARDSIDSSEVADSASKALLQEPAPWALTFSEEPGELSSRPCCIVSAVGSLLKLRIDL